MRDSLVETIFKWSFFILLCHLNGFSIWVMHFYFVRRDVKNAGKTLKDVGLINEYPS